MSNRDKGGLKLVQPTKEELDQLRELIAEHPWQLTYGVFLKRVVSEYGFELHYMDVVDPQGESVRLPYLKDGDVIVRDDIEVRRRPRSVGANDILPFAPANCA